VTSDGFRSASDRPLGTTSIVRSRPTTACDVTSAHSTWPLEDVGYSGLSVNPERRGHGRTFRASVSMTIVLRASSAAIAATFRRDDCGDAHILTRKRESQSARARTRNVQIRQLISVRGWIEERRRGSIGGTSAAVGIARTRSYRRQHACTCHALEFMLVAHSRMPHLTGERRAKAKRDSKGERRGEKRDGWRIELRVPRAPRVTARSYSWPAFRASVSAVDACDTSDFAESRSAIQAIVSVDGTSATAWRLVGAEIFANC